MGLPMIHSTEARGGEGGFRSGSVGGSRGLGEVCGHIGGRVRASLSSSPCSTGRQFGGCPLWRLARGWRWLGACCTLWCALGDGEGGAAV